MMIFYSSALICFLFCFSMLSAENVFLKTPNLSPENVIGQNVGIRPFRKAGVRLESQLIQDKLIIHNYGYGGSGLTLAFGASHEVLKLLQQHNSTSKTVAVLGGGVVGLATAYDLLKQGYEVHLYAADWSPNLTSNVAAGIWTPLNFPETMPEEKKLLHASLLKTAEERFLKSTGNDPEFDGVHIITVYGFESSDNTRQSINSDAVGEDIVLHFDNGVTKKAKRTREIGMDGKIFMADLFEKVKANGAILHQRRFSDLDDVLSLKETLVVNCMSLGSREIFNDQELFPVRGQILYYKPLEGQDYLLIGNLPNESEDKYYFFFSYPWSDRMIVGGVYEFNQEELANSSEVTARLIENSKQVLR